MDMRTGKRLSAACLFGMCLMMFTQAAPAKTTDEVEYGDWKFTAMYDPLDEESYYSASIINDKHMLLIKCDEEGDAPYARFLKLRTYFGDGDGVSVKYKVDDRELRKEKWMLTDDGVIQYDEQEAETFAQRLKQGRKLIFETRDYEYDTHRATFSLDGAQKAISKMYKKCQE